MTAVAKTDTAVPAKAPLKAGGSLHAIVPQDAEQAYRMAQMIATSGIAPRDMNRPEQIVTAILHGLEIGLKPLQAVQSIAVVNGRPTIWGDAALGLVQGSGLLEDFEEKIEGSGDTMAAVCTAKRRDRATPIVRRFTVADARRAGLWDKTGPWKQYPTRMLQMRARSWALRDGFPDVLKGLGLTEEVRDFHSMPVVGESGPRVTADEIKRQAQPKITEAEIIEPRSPQAPAAQEAEEKSDEAAGAAPGEEKADDDPEAVAWNGWLNIRQQEADGYTTLEQIADMEAHFKTVLDDEKAPTDIRQRFAAIIVAAKQRVSGGRKR